MRQGTVEDGREIELTAFGVPPEEARQWIAQQTPEATDEDGNPLDDAAADPSMPFAVWPENADVVKLFLQLQTQWRASPTGRLVGLRYGAAARVMRIGRMRRKKRLFGALQDMERAVLEGQGDEH